MEAKPAGELIMIRCSLCNSKNVVLYLNQVYKPDFLKRYNSKSTKRWDHYRCKDCESVFLHPKPTKKDLDEIYNSKGYRFFWEKNYNKNIEIRYKMEEEKIEVFLKKINNRGGNILDIGCNLGTFLHKISPYFNGLYGMEYSKKVLKHINKNKIKIIENTKLVQNNFFDVICMWDVLEHINNPTIYLKEVYRMLKDGGQFILSTPNPNSITLIFLKEKWHQIEPPSHIFFFGKKYFLNFFKDYGLKTLKITCDSQFGLNPPISFYCIFSRLLGFENIKLEQDAEKLSRQEKLPFFKQIVYRLYKQISSILSFPINKAGYGDYLLVVAQK